MEEQEQGVIFYDPSGGLPYTLPDGRKQSPPALRATPLALRDARVHGTQPFPRQKHSWSRSGAAQSRGSCNVYHLRPLQHNGAQRRVARSLAQATATSAIMDQLRGIPRVSATRGTDTTNWSQSAAGQAAFPTRPFIRRNDASVLLTRQEQKTMAVGTPLMYRERARYDPSGRFRIRTRQTPGPGVFGRPSKRNTI